MDRFDVNTLNDAVRDGEQALVLARELGHGLDKQAMLADSLANSAIWQALAALSGVARSQGDDEEVELEREAREVAGMVAERIRQEGIRAAFLRQPAVRKVMSDG